MSENTPDDSSANGGQNPEPLISQEELDAALRAARNEKEKTAKPPTAGSPPQAESPDRIPSHPSHPIPPDLGLISQGELDRIAELHAGQKSKPTPDERSTDELPTVWQAELEADAEIENVAQDEIDQLIKAVQANVPELSENLPSTEAIKPKPPADAAPPPGEAGDTHHKVLRAQRQDDSVNRDEIDRLLREAAEQVASKRPEQPSIPEEFTEVPRSETQPSDSGATAQDEIDILLRQTNELSQHREGADKKTADQQDPSGRNEVDHLLNRATEPSEEREPLTSGGDAESSGDSPDSPIPSAAEAPDQPEDALPQVPIDQPSQPEQVESDSKALSQEELDGLLTGASSEDVINDPDLDAPLVEADQASVPDLDPLVSAEAGERGKVDEGPPKGPPVPDSISHVPEPAASQDSREPGPVERATGGATESDIGSENLAAAVPQPDDLLDAILGKSPKKESADLPSEGLEIASVDELTADAGAAKTTGDARAREGVAAPRATGATRATYARVREGRAVQGPDESPADLDLDPSPADGPSSSGAPARKAFRRAAGRAVLDKNSGPRSGGTRKTWISMAAGLLCTVATVLLLLNYSARLPDLGLQSRPDRKDLPAVVRSAQALMDLHQYDEAKDLLAPALKNAEPSPVLAEARYLYIEARYRALPETVSDKETETLHRDIDDQVAMAPGSSKNGVLLRWKADLYERSGAAVAALDTYRDLLDTYTDAEDGDEMLIRAAQLAARINRPEESQAFLLRLLQRYPLSPYAAQANLLLGGAKVAEGSTTDEGRRLYTHVSPSQQDTVLGAEAVARLAQTDIDRGAYTQAIEELERWRGTATTAEGADTIALLLAKAYRAKGDPKKAQEILRELINAFPDSDKVAGAYIELSQILDETGDRREALKLAMQASQRFPEQPEVLINQGDLLQRAGKNVEAAEQLVAAVQAGDAKPSTLLAAGNAFARANELQKARKAYERLLTEFPTAPEAFKANIELAKTLQKQGQSEAALNRLTNLAGASLGNPQRVPILVALGELYTDLGFSGRAADAFENAATLTSDSETLAQSATSLLRAGESSLGLAVAYRVDTSKLSPDTAYEFLMNYGRALLRMDSTMAEEKLEQAYRLYPKQRTEEGDLALLKTYLQTGQTARARALVIDLATYVKSNPGEVPRLQRTATQWADALFDRGDYRSAAEAYAMAAEAAPDTEDASWDRFQQANALLELREFEESIALLNNVASTDSPFAEDARLKAAYARLEQRLHNDRAVVTPANAGG